MGSSVPKSTRVNPGPGVGAGAAGAQIDALAGAGELRSEAGVPWGNLGDDDVHGVAAALGAVGVVLGVVVDVGGPDALGEHVLCEIRSERRIGDTGETEVGLETCTKGPLVRKSQKSLSVRGTGGNTWCLECWALGVRGRKEAGQSCALEGGL